MEDRCSRLVALDSLFREELSWFTHLRPGSGDITMPVETKAMASLNTDKYLITFKLTKEGALIKAGESDVKVVGEPKKKPEEHTEKVMEVWNKPYGWFFLPGEKIPIVE